MDMDPPTASGPKKRKRGKPSPSSEANQKGDVSEQDKEPKAGLHYGLPPISDLHEIFRDITKKSVARGFGDAIQHLNVLGDYTSIPFSVEHVASAEIVPFKQAYIERNFAPPILFRDVLELGNKEALTAYGSMRPVPGNVDILIAGSSCVDFSSLNSKAKELRDEGIKPTDKRKASTETYTALLTYAHTQRPKIAIVENVFNAPWEQFEDAWRTAGEYVREHDEVGKDRHRKGISDKGKGCHDESREGEAGQDGLGEDNGKDLAEYVVTHIKCNTRDYYLPQTRNRGYLVAFLKQTPQDAPGRKEEEEALGEACKQWKESMQYFRRPASSHCAHFLLDDNDPRFQQARRDVENEFRVANTRDINWAKCKGRHQKIRNELGLDSNHTISGFQEGGGGNVKADEAMWPRFLKFQGERVLDTIDLQWGRALLNQQRDSRYVFRAWDLSQNLDRETDMKPAGIIGCVTPSGQLFFPSQGRPILGIEALIFQGLPVDRLLLTRETPRQLQDLAGNAMSTTVIGAAILSSLMAGYKTLDRGSPSTNNKLISSVAQIVPLTIPSDREIINLGSVVDITVASLCLLASQSQALCACEGLTLGKRGPFQRCQECGYAACYACSGNPQHSFLDIPEQIVNDRKEYWEMRDILNNALPMRLILRGFGKETLMSCLSESQLYTSNKEYTRISELLEGFDEDELHYQTIHRASKLVVKYEGLRSFLELRIDSQTSHWQYFLKPPASEPVNSKLRKLFSTPVARMQPKTHVLQGDWELFVPSPIRFEAMLTSNGSQVPRFEIQQGLGEKKSNGMTCVWNTIHVATNEVLNPDIRGEYKLLQQCRSAFGRLHRQVRGIDNRAVARENAVYLLFDHDPLQEHGEKNDTLVFATEHQPLRIGETRQVVAKFASRKDLCTEPGKLLSNSQEDRQCMTPGQWKRSRDLTLDVFDPSTHVICTTPSYHETIVRMSLTDSTCARPLTILKCSINLRGKQGKQRFVDLLSKPYLSTPGRMLNECAWLLERCRIATNIKKFTDWITLPLVQSRVVCNNCSPPKPRIDWRFNRRNQLVPYEDEQEAGEFERRLKGRPKPINPSVNVDDHDVAHVEVDLNIWTLLHRAAAPLAPVEEAEQIELAWRLSTTDSLLQSQPRVEFNLKNNEDNVAFAGDYHFVDGICLRPQQLRSLEWMRAMESTSLEPFEDVEVEETILPSMRWRVEAKASVKRQRFGGVLADEVGYGKTALVLALIGSSFEDYQLPQTPGRIPVKASLIVVPGTLLSQWREETEKFLRGVKGGRRPKVILIATYGDLERLTIRDIKDCDIILAAWGLLYIAEDAFISRMEPFAGVPKPGTKEKRVISRFLEQVIDATKINAEILKWGKLNDLTKHLEKLQQERESKRIVKFAPSRLLKGKELENHPHPSAASSSSRPASPAPATKKRNPKVKNFKTLFGATGKDDAPSEDMRCPLLYLFHFQRVVVDEFSFVDGHTIEGQTPAGQALADAVKSGLEDGIKAISARSRWVLSGTPFLKDFAQIKNMSSLVGITLGIDDDDKGGANAGRRGPSAQSSAEQFRSFIERRSLHWHHQRTKHAQHFLDCYVRSNNAAIKEIKVQEHVHVVFGSLLERVLYLEIHQQLVSQSMSLETRRPGKVNDERRRRLDVILSSSGSAGEVLVRAASSIMWQPPRSNPQDCGNIAKMRKDELTTVEAGLKILICQATWLRNYSTMVSTSMSAQISLDVVEANWKQWTSDSLANAMNLDALTTLHRDALRGRFDQDTTTVLLPLFGSAANNSTFREVHHYYAVDVPVPSETASIDGASEDEMDIEGVKSLPKLPTKHLEVDRELRSVVAAVRGGIKELQNRTRALRFFNSILAYESITPDFPGTTKEPSEISSAISEGMSQPTLSCPAPSCGSDETFETFRILGSCGHIGCSRCVENPGRDGKCIVDGCLAQSWDYSVFGVASVLTMPLTPQGAYGSKFDHLVELLRGNVGEEHSRVHEDDKAIVFVQFKSMMFIVKAVLHAANIKHTDVSEVEKFKTAKAQEFKALLLELDSVSAAGFNLFTANHVVFVSPLQVPTRQKYTATMTQAIGRARRYGQEKCVHIHRFLAANTFEVDVVKDLERKALVKRGKDHVFVTIAEVAGNEETWGGPTLHPEFALLDEDEVEEEEDATV